MTTLSQVESRTVKASTRRPSGWDGPTAATGESARAQTLQHFAGSCVLLTPTTQSLVGCSGEASDYSISEVIAWNRGFARGELQGVTQYLTHRINLGNTRSGSGSALRAALKSKATESVSR